MGLSTSSSSSLLLPWGRGGGRLEVEGGREWCRSSVGLWGNV